MKKFLATLLALTMLIGMVGMIPASAEEVVTLKWVTVGCRHAHQLRRVGRPSSTPIWQEKIGVNIEMDSHRLGATGTIAAMSSSTPTSPMIMIFGNNGHLQQRREAGRVSGDHRGHAEGKRRPSLLDLIPAGYWDACRVNGKHVRLCPPTRTAP